MECTWSPEWFLFQVTDACKLHDLGASDETFFWAIVALGSAAGFRYGKYIVATAYYLGVKIGGPFYRAYQAYKSRT